MKRPEGPPVASSQTTSTALRRGEGLTETPVTHEAVSFEGSWKREFCNLPGKPF